MANAGQAKLCVVCGNDCAGKPRTKDPKGRYYCRSCYESAKQAVASPAKREYNPLDEMLAETDSSQETASTACRNCGAAMPADAVICTACGVNMQSGAAIATQVEKSEGASTDWLRQPMTFGLGTLAFFAATFSLAFVRTEAAAVLFLSVLALSVGVMVHSIVLSFKMSVVQGLLVLLVPGYIIWFVFGVSENAHLKWAFAAWLGGWLMLCTSLFFL